MIMKEVQSSNIKAVGYDDKDLIVEYIGGTKYRYKDVPKAVYENLLEAESKGSFMNMRIKGAYLYERLEGEKNENM